MALLVIAIVVVAVMVILMLFLLLEDNNTREVKTKNGNQKNNVYGSGDICIADNYRGALLRSPVMIWR